MRSVDDLTMYVYRLLGEAQEEDVRSHVESCASCARRVGRIEAEHGLFEEALAREEADPAVRARMTGDVLARRPTPRRPVEAAREIRGLHAFLRGATGASAALCVVLLLATSGRPPAPENPAAPRREALAYVQDAVVGSIVARDEEGREVGPLGLQSHRVAVEIQDGIAKTTVEENFRNPTDRRLEGTFRFPLPPDASISRLALEVNGKMEEGTCVERERAREVFESIVRKMQDPALLEWMPGGIFQCRIFPIEPRATKRVIVAYTQALPFFRGKTAYVYPLASEKIAAHPPEELRIEVRARFSGTLSRIECPSHLVDVQRRSANEATVAFAVSNARPKNDFVVSMETADDELRVVPHKVDGDDGYFALFLTPRGEPARKPGRYVLVLDVSASVTAPELEVARRLVRAILERRIPGARFEILAHHIDVLPGGEVDLRRANDFMDRLSPVGGSDVLGALRAAPEGEIVYIGKGTPTYGETDPAKILEALKGRRIRTIGVGTKANVDLLQKLGGHFRISPNDDVPRRVAEIAATLGSPVLSDIRVQGGEAVYDVAGVRDIFYGERLMVAGRYRGPAAKLVVTGRDYRREIDVVLPAKEEGHNYVRRLWAQRRIADLLAQGEATKPTVTELGVKHQIMTPYTSFLVLENEQMWKDHQLKREVQAQDRVLSRKEGESPAMSDGVVTGKITKLPFGLGSETGMPGRARPSIDEPTGQAGPGFSAQESARLEAWDIRSQTFHTFLRLDPLVQTVADPAEVRTPSGQFGGLEFSLGEASKPSDTPARAEAPGFARFSLVSNGATPSIDLPRISEAGLVPRHLIRLNHLEPPPGTTAKVEEHRIINGRPPESAPAIEEMLRRFALMRVIEGELSRDSSDRVIGTAQFDSQTNCFVVRDTKAVLDRIAVWLEAVDVEAGAPPRNAGEAELRAAYEARTRRLRPLVSLRLREATLEQAVEEIRLQTGWSISAPPGFRIDELVVENEPAEKALEVCARKAGLAVREGADGSFTLSPEARLSLDVRDAELRAIVDRIARAAGAEIAVAPGVTGSVTLKSQDVPWGELLSSIAKTLGLVAIRRGPGRILITPPDAALREMEVRVFRLRHVVPREDPYPDLGRLLEALLSRDPDGRVLGRVQFVGDARACIVVDVDPSRLRIQEVAEFLDVEPGKPPPPFVLKHSYPPGVPALLEEARRRTAAPAGEPRRDEEIRKALRRAATEIEKHQEGGRLAVEVESAGDPPDGVVLSGGSRAWLRAGQVFAVARDGEFKAIVKLQEVLEDRARGSVWRGLAAGRVLPGDRAERIRDVQAHLDALPAATREAIAARANLEAIREKMKRKQ